jgi:HlyD family secretion protein
LVDPFGCYGILTGKLTHLSADATELNKGNAPSSNTSNANSGTTDNSNPATSIATYKARIQLARPTLLDAQGNKLLIAPGMQVVAEINQGKRSVLEYLLSPVQKAVSEAGRER